MDRDQVLAVLRSHEPELKAAGLVHLRLFGSVARGEQTDQSDVDLLCDFDAARRQTLVSMGSLRTRLVEMLGTEVDLCSVDRLKPYVRTKALQEAVIAF